MFQRCLPGGLLLLGLATLLHARPGVITTNDGRHVVGDVIDSGGDIVNITTHGIATGFLRPNIDHIEYVDEIQREFNDRLGKLPDSDVKGKVNLAHWAMDREQFDLALQAATAAQKADPSNADVNQLINSIQNQQILQARVTAAEAFATTMPAKAPATAPSNVPSKFLSADDINKIRQTELRPTDNVRINFLNNVRQRYLTATKSDPTTFDSLSVVGQALAILNVSDPDLARDVRIVTDPATLVEFRSQILPRLVLGCAASGCHSTSTSTDFFLYPNTGDTASWFTNLYILQTHRTRMIVTDIFGTGPAMRPMIDRNRPDDSPIAEYSLPANQVKNPHPKVAGWKPLYIDQQDPGYVRLTNWMGTMLKPVVEEDFGIKFMVPAPGATTRPATTMPDAAPTAQAPNPLPLPADLGVPPAASDVGPAMFNK